MSHDAYTVASKIKSVEETDKTPDSKYRRWKDEITMAEKEFANFHTRGRNTVRRYKDERDSVDGSERKFNIFTTNVNALLLSTYMEASDTTLGWTSEEEVADFKTNERPRMTTMAGLNKLPRGGEAQHNERSDVGETYRIARYAGQFVIDEQDIIDDNLSALKDYPIAGGMAAARLRPDLVYSILLSNPTLSATSRALFNTTDGNALTTAALAADKLRAAVKTMMLFQENSESSLRLGAPDAKGIRGVVSPEGLPVLVGFPAGVIRPSSFVVNVAT